MTKYKIMVSAFEEHKEILLYEQPDIDITTPWQWLRENFPLFEWKPILNDSEDFIQYEAKTINEDDDRDGGKPESSLLVTFMQEIKNYRMMEKTKDGIKKMLKEQWEKACNGYLVELLRMWELDAHYGYWVGDEVGTMYCYGETHNLTMENIIYIVENDIEENEVIEWEDYCLDAHEFGFDIPNLRSWHRGCPRTSKETFDALRMMKNNLATAVEEEKERIKNAKS